MGDLDGYKYYKENKELEREQRKLKKQINQEPENLLVKTLSVTVPSRLADKIVAISKEKNIPVSRLYGKIAYKFLEEYESSSDKDSMIDIFPHISPEFDNPSIEDIRKAVDFLKKFYEFGVHPDVYYMSHDHMGLSLKTSSDCLNKLIAMEIAEIKQIKPRWAVKLKRDLPPEPRILLSKEFKIYDKETSKGV